jgi:hypothetical protein
MIHFVFAILINKNFNEFETSNDERCDILTKKKTQLQLLILDEISLVGNRMLSFINRRLCIIKHLFMTISWAV